MILADHEISAAIAAKVVIIRPFHPEHIDVNAYELHLGDTVLRQAIGGIIDLSKPDDKDFEPLAIDPEAGFVLEPQHMILWMTEEEIELPLHLAGEIDGRSTLARYGIMPVVASRFIKPGSKGKQTLEIFNAGSRAVRLVPGLAVAKLLLHTLSAAAEKGYDGRYQNQRDGRPKK